LVRNTSTMAKRCAFVASAEMSSARPA